MRKAGIEHVVCLASTEPERRYDLWPHGLDWLAKVNCLGPIDLADALCPTDQSPTSTGSEFARQEAQRDWNVIQDIARRVLLSCLSGKGVLVHCEYGVERTGLLIALVLCLGENRIPPKIPKRIGDSLCPSLPEKSPVLDAWSALLIHAAFSRMLPNL